MADPTGAVTWAAGITTDPARPPALLAGKAQIGGLARIVGRRMFFHAKHLEKRIAQCGDQDAGR
jgi:hypothetical protein